MSVDMLLALTLITVHRSHELDFFFPSSLLRTLQELQPELVPADNHELFLLPVLLLSDAA